MRNEAGNYRCQIMPIAYQCHFRLFVYLLFNRSRIVAGQADIFFYKSSEKRGYENIRILNNTRLNEK